MSLLDGCKKDCCLWTASSASSSTISLSVSQSGQGSVCGLSASRGFRRIIFSLVAIRAVLGCSRTTREQNWATGRTHLEGFSIFNRSPPVRSLYQGWKATTLHFSALSAIEVAKRGRSRFRRSRPPNCSAFSTVKSNPRHQIYPVAG